MAKMNETVITVDGTEEIRSNCRRIKGNYYRIGDPTVKGSGQCYFVKGKYRREETGYIVFDESKGEYVVASEASFIEGVVAIEGETLKMGSFSEPEYKVKIYDRQGSSYVLMNEEIVSDNRYYRYHLAKDAYLHIDTLPAKSFNKLPMLSAGYKNTLEYDCRNILKSYVKAYDRNTLKIAPKVSKLAPLLKDLSFGIEFETSAGKIPERFTAPLGLIPLRDGSVSGLEYATIPYSGEKGLQAAVEATQVLNKFTKYDSNCSLHLHIGNIPRTEEFFLALFKVLSLIQDEVFDMFPLYKKYNFGVKRKNFTKPFPAAKMLNKMDSVITDNNIKSNFGVLYEFLSAGQRYEDVGESLDNVTAHPSDPNGTRKWNIKSRYYWVNLIPLLFGNKKTVEFRIHTPTTDVNKVIYYLIMCTSIISFVKNNTKMILTSRDSSYGDLGNILMTELRDNPSGLLDYVLHYINIRKKSVMRDNHEGNIRGDENRIKAPDYKISGSGKKEVINNHGIRTHADLVDAMRGWQ